jgi:hypothetical protein
MAGTVIIEEKAGRLEQYFPGPPPEFSNIHYAYDTFPESAARELSGDLRYICHSAQKDDRDPAPS